MNGLKKPAVNERKIFSDIIPIQSQTGAATFRSKSNVVVFYNDISEMASLRASAETVSSREIGAGNHFYEAGRRIEIKPTNESPPFPRGDYRGVTE